jgi:hypothetical protein
MRSIIFAVLVAAGVGLVGTSSGSAAPVRGLAILDAAGLTTAVEQAQYWHSRRRSHWRRGSRGGWCHRPWSSRVRPC